MGFSSAWHWILVLVVILILFGAGKLPRVMGDLAKGIKNFKAGLKDDETVPGSPPATMDDDTAATTTTRTTYTAPGEGRTTTTTYTAAPSGETRTPV